MLLRNRFPRLIAVASHKHLSVSTWLNRFAASCHLGFGIQLDPEGQGELAQLIRMVRNVSLSTTADDFVWRWNLKGNFSTWSAYKFLVYDGVDDRRIPHLWTIKIPLRAKIFLWLAGRNRVLTAEQLVERGWSGPTICLLCCQDEENLDHLLFRCAYAIAVWNRLLHGYRRTCRSLLTSPGNLASRWCRARRPLEGQARTALDLCLAAGCWEIWLERNHRIFDDRPTSSVDCCKRIVATINIWSCVLGGK